MAALALLITTLFLAQKAKNYKVAIYPMYFMYITTVCGLFYMAFFKLIPAALKGQKVFGNVFAAAVAEALRLEAHFTRPYGKLMSDMVYDKAAGYTALLKKAKHILDPNHIMNPGTLCF